MNGPRDVALKLPPGLGGGTQVLIGEHDVTSAVRSLSLRAGVGAAPVLELEILAFEVDGEAGQVQVVIPDATRRALIALGWTPPPDAEP